ncbi:hypothetical protein AB0B45_14555 [Nonomuraea sp. NPDC049152]|uniref:hypothetical protein n=1 Tax=Nonomuraea sp. NPDC049152 TaxID=3154350 RepID=UPI00340A3BA6
MLDEAAHLLRRERHLHDLCLQPGPVKEIRIAGSGGFLDSRAAALWTKATGRELGARARSGAWQFLGWVIFTAGYVTAIAIASQLAIGGKASIGDVVLVITLGSRLQGQMSTTTGTINHVVDGRRLLEHCACRKCHPARSLALQAFFSGQGNLRSPGKTICAA